jgi:hypothetical protein
VGTQEASRTLVSGRRPQSLGHPAQPGLYRPRDDGKRKSVNELLEIDHDLYTEFDRCATQLSLADADAVDDEWDSYFLMQHHGVPTRLLDWSDGSLIALHFAVNKKKRVADS